MRSFFQEFKTPIVTIVLIFIAFFLYTKLAGPIPFYINSVQTTKTDLFSSSGEGKATAVPDSATVSLGVTAQGSTVAEAQNKANQTADKIISAVKKLGITDKDIKTTNYSVNPDYGQGGGIQPLIYPPVPINNGNQAITGYTVTQNLEIKVKPIEKANKVVDAGTSNGANLVGGVNYTFSDELQKSLENQARVQAVNNAKDKAQSLANAAGVHLGRVINVVEIGNGFPQPMAMKAGSTTSDSTTPTNVTPGENSVTIDVTIYYETY